MKIVKNLSVVIILLLGIMFLNGCGRTKVSILFDEDGGSFVEDFLKIDIDEDFILPETEKENHVFLGWYFDFEKMDVESIKFYFNRDKNFGKMNLIAKWEIDKHIVKFYDGNKLVKEEVVEHDQSAEPAEAYLDYKPGHTFVKWDKDFSNITEDLEVQAIWIKNNYKIKYVDYDSTVLKEINVEFDQDLETIVPPTPLRQGFDFLRWSNDLPSKMPANNIEIFAVYGYKEYTISFVKNGGSGVSSITQGFDTEVNKPLDPVKKGQTFLGWYLDEGLTENYTFSKMPYEDITLYAKWENKIYTIKYLDYNQDVLKEVTRAYNQELNDINTPVTSRIGYSFIGWDKTLPSFMPDYDIILTTIYSLNKYTISFNEKGGSKIESITQDYGTTVNKPMDPIKENCLFLGWFLDESFEEHYVFSTMPSENIELFAKWLVDDSSLVNFENFMILKLDEEITSNIVLPKTYEGIDISWSSNKESILSETGIFTRPYIKSIVYLTANLEFNNQSYTLVFEASVDGYKVLETGIASSYIYRQYTNVTDGYFQILDIINCAFITANSNGTLSGTPFLNNVSRYILPKAKEKGCWVLMSIAPDSKWSTIAASPALVETFANSIVSVINQYGFDGVDLDWETPTSSESVSFVALAKKVNEKVKANNPNHLVTAAIGGGMWQPPRYNLKDSHQYLDYINMMTYGMVTGNGQYQNALFPSKTFDNLENKAGATLTSCSISESVAIYSSFNIPYKKIIVGLAFYGIRQTRTYDSANESWTSWTNTSSPHYHTIVNSYLNNSNYQVYFDDIAKVPYILKNDGTEFISYDNHESILAKSAYILNEKLGGLMFWESGTDTTNTLINSMGIGLGKK